MKKLIRFSLKDYKKIEKKETSRSFPSHIRPLQKQTQKWDNHLRKLWSQKSIKPESYGNLRELSIRLSTILNSDKAIFVNPHLLIFAADHGFTENRKHIFGPLTTTESARNIIEEKSPLKYCQNQSDLNIILVNAGVRGNLSKINPPFRKNFLNKAMAESSRDICTTKAMERDQTLLCLARGAEIIDQLFQEQCNFVALSDIGQGNNLSASILFHRLSGLPLKHCIYQEGEKKETILAARKRIIKQALRRSNKDSSDPIALLSQYGSFEIAMLCGAMLKAAEYSMVILIDSFTALTTLLLASKLNPHVLEYVFISHSNSDPTQKSLLRYLNKQTILSFDLYRAEGLGVVLAYPILQAALNFLNHPENLE